MSGGIHPPIDVVMSWPKPDYIHPATRPKAATILACVFGPLTMFLLIARLWVRMRIQRNTGLDDWLMIVASVPLLALTVLVPLVADVYHFNKHTWDVQPRFYVIQRKYVMAIESTFCVASGLIKISILLFYKRLGARAVSNTFRWATRLTIAFIIAYSIAFTLVPIFGCQPISAFWDQIDLAKVAKGYEYKCFNEGADVFSAAVISSAQDLLTAILPTFLYWHLQIPVPQKAALFGIFAIGYGVVAIGILRSYYSWQIFFETYDVTWVTWHILTWALLEVHIGAICANAPALKVFFRQVLKIKTSNAGTKPENKNNATRSSTNKPSCSSFSASTYSKMSLWKPGPQCRKYGHLSEPYPDLTADSHDDIQTQQGGRVAHSPPSKRSSVDTMSGQFDDIEMGVFRMQSPSQSHHPIRSALPSQEDLQVLPRIPSPYPKAHLPAPSAPNRVPDNKAHDGKPTWQSWS